MRKLLDVLVGPGLLAAKLVAGKGEDLQPAVAVPRKQLGKLSVVLGRQTSFCCDIHKDADLAAAAFAEVDAVARDVGRRKAMDGRRRRGGGR